MTRRSARTEQTPAPSAKAVKQNELVSAAVEYFQRYGVQRTRVEDIAGAAGLSGPNFYNYFPSRAALIDAVVMREVGRVVDQAGPTIHHTENLRNALIDGVVEIVEAFRANDVLMQLLRMTRHARLGDLGMEPSAFGHEMLVRLWQPGLDRARERGELRPNLRDEKTIAWLGSVIVLFILREHQPTRDEIAATMRDYVAPSIVTSSADTGATP
jgi:AcrR family transcriptional regulator